MFTAEERIKRATTVVRDAFRGLPAIWTQDEDDGTLWRGEVPDESDWKTGKPLVTIEIRIPPDYTVLTERTAEGRGEKAYVKTYDELARWVFKLSRKYKQQEWVTPRHFCCLVNEIFAMDPPLDYKETWPHEHKVTLPNGVRFDFEWDDEECRIVVVVAGRGGVGMRSPEDAIGWLSALKQECGLCQSP